jgi:hypothetical protein
MRRNPIIKRISKIYLNSSDICEATSHTPPNPLLIEGELNTYISMTYSPSIKRGLGGVLRINKSSFFSRVLVGLFFLLSFVLVSYAHTDSSKIEVRTPDKSKLDNLKKELDFGIIKTPDDPVKKFFNELRRWIFEKLFGIETDNVGKFIFTLIFAAAAFFVFFFLFKSGNMPFMIKSNKDSKLIIHGEEISNIDFENEIIKCVNNNDFKRAVRLHFLIVLTVLSDKNLIMLRHDKTNFEYLNEIKEIEIRKSFSRVSTIFEFIQYGDFVIDGNIYYQIETKFKSLRTLLIGQSVIAI